MTLLNANNYPIESNVVPHKKERERNF